ncbi:MAG: ABC transporter ATP-binding protein [Spirochaetales bacterium]|nr:ABC transporter ATP-binding protein [Spirochaetales bacterium]
MIKISNVSKHYKLYERNVIDRFKDTFLGKSNYNTFKAIENVTLDIKKGEILGLVGRNGAGKSTLLKMISGITKPTSGSIEVNGRIIPLLELTAGFNMEYTGRENIYFYCSMQGMKKKEIDKIYDEVVAFSELEDFIDVPLKKYSSGMKSRLGFAVSININPDILILDEVLSVGDDLFRRKSFQKMNEFFESGKTIIFVTHSMPNIIQMCSRAVLLHKGEILYDGVPKDVVQQYNRLLSSSDKKVIDDIKAESMNKKNLDGKKQIDNEKSQMVLHNSDNDYYVEKFGEKTYKADVDSSLVVDGFNIKNSSDKKVNHLVFNKEYSFSFKLKTNVDLKKFRVICVLTGSKGEDLSVIVRPNSKTYFEVLEKDKDQQFSIKFRTLLKQGIYGLKVSIVSHEKTENEILCNINDAVVFKVLDHQFNHNRSIVSLLYSDES